MTRSQASCPATRGEADGPSQGCLRVLHVDCGNLYGGVETILVTLARCRDLYPQMESHFALCEEGRLSEELKDAQAPVHLLGKVRLSRPWQVGRARGHMRELLRQQTFDLVICHMPWSLAVFGKAIRDGGAPLGFWAHAFHTGRGWLERLAKRATPDLAIANSRFTQAGISNLFPEVPRGVVYPPVALSRAAEAEQWRSRLRGQQGVDDKTAVIVQVGRIEACKGHLLHFQALAKLIDLPQKWECWQVGGPQRPEEHEYLDQLQRAAAKYGVAGRVKWLGQRTDIPQLLAAADIFCQPNETPDSFGISFIEALWAGRPVVTTAIGGALEIVNESCGAVVEPGNAAALAKALRSLIECQELRAQLGGAGPVRAAQLCDAAMQMKAMSDLIRSVQAA
jgi:glycosyltransferase involved in cell wall biosynthesis